MQIPPGLYFLDLADHIYLTSQICADQVDHTDHARANVSVILNHVDPTHNDMYITYIYYCRSYRSLPRKYVHRI